MFTKIEHIENTPKSKSLKERKMQCVLKKKLYKSPGGMVHIWKSLQEDTVLLRLINQFKNLLDPEFKTALHILVDYTA